MKTLWCLHGNLQQPEVWNDLTQKLQVRDHTLQIRWVNLWETLDNDCWAWADAFCKTVVAAAEGSQNYLLGYSLGGRLAWHALIAQSELWTGAVIVSAGIADGLQREEYLSRDRTWAKRFLTEPWSELLTEWDALPVFCGRSCTIPRPAADFDRQKIARAFEAYSTGRMDDLTQRLQLLSVPVTYVTGSDDRRYCQLGQALSFQCPSLSHIEVADAGHRVPWEQPEMFRSILRKILSLRGTELSTPTEAFE
ncbi:MAG: alpha/beta fold hydrolase [Cyanobacteria bacterium P01_H01_bin.105]